MYCKCSATWRSLHDATPSNRIRSSKCHQPWSARCGSCLRQCAAMIFGFPHTAGQCLAPNHQSLACTARMCLVHTLSGTQVIHRGRQSEHHRTSRGKSLDRRQTPAVCSPRSMVNGRVRRTNLAATAATPCTDQLGMRGLDLGRSQLRSQPRSRSSGQRGYPVF